MYKQTNQHPSPQSKQCQRLAWPHHKLDCQGRPENAPLYEALHEVYDVHPIWARDRIDRAMGRFRTEYMFEIQAIVVRALSLHAMVSEDGTIDMSEWDNVTSKWVVVIPLEIRQGSHRKEYQHLGVNRVMTVSWDDVGGGGPAVPHLKRALVSRHPAYAIGVRVVDTPEGGPFKLYNPIQVDVNSIDIPTLLMHRRSQGTWEEAVTLLLNAVERGRGQAINRPI